MYTATIRTESTTYVINPAFPAIDDTPDEIAESQLISIGINSILGDVRIKTVVIMRNSTYVAKMWRTSGDVFMKYPSKFSDTALIGGVSLLNK